MNIRFIQYIGVSIICGLSVFTLHLIIRRQKRRKAKVWEKHIQPDPRILYKLQALVENISVMREGNRFIIPQLPKPRWVKVGKVTSLRAYPLVSGKACTVDECYVKFEGMYMYNKGQLINWDRSFVVYNVDTKCIINTNNFPALNEVNLSIMNNYVILQADRMPILWIKLRDNEIVECTYWCCEKIRPLPNIVCCDCGDEAAQWLSRFLWGKESGLRLGYAINAVGCMGIYWQLMLRNCIMYQKAVRNKHNLMFEMNPFVNVLHSVVISQMPYENISETLKIFEPSEKICPNIVVLASNLHIEEQWEWIKIGNIIIRNSQPLVWSSKNSIITNLKLFGLGVNCELYVMGRVKIDDNVYLHIPEKIK